MQVICSGARYCGMTNCKHTKPHEYTVDYRYGSICEQRICNFSRGNILVKCHVVASDKKSVEDIMPKTIKIDPMTKREIMKSLNLYQTVWYHQIPCFIDCLHSGEGFTGKGDVRIVPEDKQLHMKGASTVLQCAGKWIDIDEVAFSVHPPPMPVTWKNAKGSRAGTFDFNKAKALGSLLAEGKTLLLKYRGFNGSHVSVVIFL